MRQVKDILDVMDHVLRLKRFNRSGWCYYGVFAPESIADHSFSVSFLSMLLVEFFRERGYKVDETKVLKMAILHEIGESRLGDLQLDARRLLGMDYISKVERKAVNEILEAFPELSKIWNEFEDGKTLEALIVKIADKLELLLQALDYEKRGAKNLDKIFDETENRKNFGKLPFIEEFVNEICKKRGEKL